MPRNRTIATLGLTLVVVASALAQDPLPANPQGAAPGAGATAEPAAPPTEAEKKIDDALAKVKAVESASAEIRMVSEMLNQKIRLEGEYKKAPGNRMFLLLILQGSADATDRMLQISDGTTAYEFVKVLDSQTCSKRTLKPILAVLNKPEFDAKIREELLSGLGFAGPEALLAGLRKSFVFDQMREDKFEGRAVWVLGGSWKDTKSPLTPTGTTATLGGPLPPYVPSLVTLYIDQETGWPYQVEFDGRKPTQIEMGKRMPEVTKLDPSGRAISNKLTAPAARPSKMVLTYTKVVLGATIPDETFAFTPPQQTTIRDETEQLVAQLEQVMAASVAKRTQAAKAAPVLEGGVTAPAPAGDPSPKPQP